MESPTPINVAEAVFEPFWDPNLSGLDEWTVTAPPESDATVEQTWCWAAVEWTDPPAEDAAALELSRAVEVDCSDYERLLVSAVLPEDCVLGVETTTDLGRRCHEATPSDGARREYAFPLDGARELREVTLRLYPGSGGRGDGWVNWLGLQDPERLDAHLAQWDRLDARWSDHLRGPDYDPDFEPASGLLLDAGDLAALRTAHERTGLLADLVATAREAADRPPEERVSDFLAGSGDRYTRDRDRAGALGPADLDRALAAAVASLVTEDAALGRLAARYAMSVATVGRWDEGFVSRFPGSAWAHRSFLPSQILHALALVLDLAGEWFTDAGRQYLRRRLVEDGLDTVTYDTWRYDYIFENNQLAWFSHGRLAALAHLEAEWPRAEPYADVAYRELCDSVDRIVLDDGGYVEGPSYFASVVSHGGRAASYYARARGLDLSAALPDAFERTGPLAAALASTDPAQDVVPICDGTATMPPDALALLATLLPDSPWPRLLARALDRRDGGLEDALAARLVADLDLPPGRLGAEDLPAFTRLPEMGAVASIRSIDGEPVKVFLPGNRAGAGHAHEDAGGFVLEFAGETFAMDPGTADYGRPLAGRLKHCDRHNMLVPVGTGGRAAPANPLPHDVKPEAEGDRESFRARVDAAPGWADYERWERTLASPTPAELRVTDEWALAAGTGVEFHWQVPDGIRVDRSGDGVRLTGERGAVDVAAPPDAEVRVEAVPMPGGEATRVTFGYAGVSGDETVTARLSLRD